MGGNIGEMTPIQYQKMIELLESFKPKRICELGSGLSTKIFNDFDAINYSIESDPRYNIYDSIYMPTIVNATLFNYKNCVLYEGFEDWLKQQDKFDFVLIDGPNDGIPFNDGNLEYARIQLFSFVILDKLSDNAIVLYHDSEREIAQRTLNEFERLLKTKGYNFNKEVIKEEDIKVIQYNKEILGVCPELTIYTLKL